MAAGWERNTLIYSARFVVVIAIHLLMADGAAMTLR